jgi:ABC-2 type transport system ATP-binding protein
VSRGTVHENGSGGSGVEVLDLVKRYPKSPVNAVDGITFVVAPGEVFGLLGPNGAGKTTTVGMLTTRVRPTSDRSISIRRNLTFHAAYHGVPAAEAAVRADELLEQFGLRERGDVKPDLFSGGQAQRVMIARALMHEPQVLFLDEPTTGLDPAARLFVWDRLRELRDRGVTLMLTTHDMHEAGMLADRVGIMDHGKLLALDTPEALMRGLPGSATLELSVRAWDNGDASGSLAGALAGLPGVERVEPLPDEPRDGQPAEWRVRLYVSGEASQLVAPSATLLAERGLALTGVELAAPTLEDVFIHLTGRTLR